MPIQQLVGCKPYNPHTQGGNIYGYKPSLAPGIVFCILFSISTLAHVVQGYWKRRFWTWLFAVGALTEVIGWGGRTWSSQCPSNLNAFLMQITTLILAPTFFTAGIYVILGRLIQIFGPETSPISATTYLWIFCSCDILSLVIQAIGGGMASIAVSAVPPRSSATGTHIMVAGIVFQMASITVFVGLFVEFLRRARRLRGALGRDIWTLVVASAFSCLMIYIRSIYRTVELAQGWTGFLITHESFFIGLDASLMLAAVATFNIIHPGWYLPTHKHMDIATSPDEGSMRDKVPDESNKNAAAADNSTSL